MFKRYPQLQSGFLAPSEEMVVIPEAPPTTPAASLLNRQPTRSNQNLFYVPAVDELVNQIIQRPLMLRDYDFQQKVLETIGKVFANQSFWTFVKLQGENPGISQLHVDFLEETIDVVLGMKPERSISLQTWCSVVSASNPAVGGFKPLTLGVKYKGSNFQTLNLGEFILLWIQRMGYSDLIISMQMLFGRRGLHGIQGGVNW